MTTKNAPFTHIGKEQLALLEELTQANGISGNEDEVRSIIRKKIEHDVDEIKIDAMGNLLAVKHASKPDALKVMLAAHMDEVGLMLVEEDGDGLFVFDTVGGMDERQLISKTVLVGESKIPGIIGCKPIHLMEPEEMHSVTGVSSMRVDVGPANKGKVKPGDYAAFATRFERSGDSIFAKALDDRLGVATLIELIKHAPEHIELLVAFTVQEEIGLRGARIAAYGFDPDLAFVVDSTPAFDLPRPDEKENTQYNCKLDCGPAIYISDAGTLSDPRLNRHLEKTALENKIIFQFRQPGGGGTDAGSVHKVRGGIPSASISVPGRYAHTPIMMARIKDWENTILLLQAALTTISPAILSEERR